MQTNSSFFRFWLAMLIVMTLLVSTAHTEDDDKELRLSSSVRFTDLSELDDDNGGMGTTEGRFDLRWRFLSLTYAQTQYRWQGIGSLGFGNGKDDPWEKLHRIALRMDYAKDISSSWFCHMGMAVTSSFEKEMDGSYGSIVRGGMGYRINDSVNLMGGFAYMRNKVRQQLLPTIGIDMDATDRFGAGWTGFIGFPSLNTAYHLDDKASFRLALERTDQTSRLADDSTVASRGYMLLTGWRTGLYFDWEPTKNASITIGPEYVMGRSLKLYDANAHVFHSENVGNGVGGIFRFRYNF